MTKRLKPEIICKIILRKNDKIFLLNHEGVISLPTIPVDSYPIIHSCIKEILKEEFYIIANEINLVKVDKFSEKIIVFLESKDWQFTFDNDSIPDQIFKSSSFTEENTCTTPILGRFFDANEVKKYLQGALIDAYSAEYIKEI